MNTPICDFVRRYADSDASRFHMPGHKGTPFLGCESLDITEISGADELYAAEGIILESEKNAAGLFGTAHTFYSAEGSTLAIKAMLALATEKSRAEKKRPLILAARNAHKAFIHACALLDLEVEWLCEDEAEHLCACRLSLSEIEKALRSSVEKPSALYITSPDYLGNIMDIGEISKLCRERGVPLLVDNAHGAYLRFLSPSQHPIDLGADICCDSAHKTLPCLTGGAYLHISKNADPEYLGSARNMMSVFATTSPSYLILQSLDLCNRYLSEGYPQRLKSCVERLDSLKSELAKQGVHIEPTEPLKLVINARAMGYSGTEAASILRRDGIEPEFSDGDFVVLMITPETRERDFERLEKSLRALKPQKPITSEALHIPTKNERVISIREAIFSPSELVPASLAVGRVCGAPTVSCPPAIPIVISGERISKEAVALFEKYGIKHVRVVKK